MKQYEVTITIDTIAKHPVHVVNRVKKAVREYGERHHDGRMLVIDSDCQQVKPPQVEVSIGARFLMDGIHYLLAQVGGAEFSLINLGTGQRWSSPFFSVQGVLNRMECGSDDWELIAEGETKSVENVFEYQRGLWSQEA